MLHSPIFREQHLGAKQVVRMQGNETIITSGEGVVHRFHYDHCFWSFDHTQSEFADQRAVFVFLAQPLLDRSFEGYNTCLFAYGQVSALQCIASLEFIFYLRSLFTSPFPSLPLSLSLYLFLSVIYLSLSH